jgi:transcriptional regulator with XRE-family HTH domain
MGLVYVSMKTELRITQPVVKALVEHGANDWPRPPRLALHMGRPTRIHKGAESRRFHYIVEWAEHMHLTQADIVRALDVDKGTVSRWFSGSIPSGMSLIRLTLLLTGNKDEPAALFRHPDDDWMAKLLRGRSADERDRIKAIIEVAFPRPAA